MNSHFIKLLLLLFVFTQKSYSQNLVSGVILDSLTQIPIAGVSVSDINSRNGTISNADGEFQILTNSLPIKLLLSHLTYKKKTVIANKTGDLRINLSVAAIHLPEFQTGNPAIAILNSVRRKALNDTTERQYYNAFYQKVSYLNGNYTKFQQMFLNVSCSSLGVERWQPTNVRNAMLNHQKNIHQNMIVVAFLNTSVIHKHTNFPINSIDLSDNYEFKIKHYLNVGMNDEVAVITCIPTKKNKNGIKFEGDIFVNTQSDNLLKIVGKNLYTVNKGWHHKVIIDINFKEDSRGFSVFDNLVLKDITTRPFQKYKNQDNIWLNFIHETKEFELQKSQPAFVMNDKNIINEVPYCPNFWSKTIPIKQTRIDEEIIQYFEKKGEFKSNF